MALRRIGEKYATDGRGLWSARNAEFVADDEPLFLLRARDIYALGTLMDYEQRVTKARCSMEHVNGVHRAVSRFREFAAAHPERMKEPGSSLRKAGER